MTKFVFAVAITLALACAASAFILPSGDLFDLPYDGCGTKVGCFGLPNGLKSSCVDTKTCDTLLTYSKGEDAGTVQFTIWSANASSTDDGRNRYVSVGINNNSSMVGAAIMNCFNRHNKFPAFSYTFAEAHKPPVNIFEPLVITELAVIHNNLLQCQFSINTTVSTNGQKYDLSTPTTLLLAGGIANGGIYIGDDTVQYHHELKDLTNPPVNPSAFPM